MYQVLYRKYRPASFSDVYGQPQVTSTLKNEIKSGRIAHAYLFTGSRGTGKTSCAKILAKAVNCLSPRDGDPCGECEICRGISDGSILDVIEMDAASNNGVGDVRSLQEELNFSPSMSKYRVYIIDEVHMMSGSAFNALLKTLEEPPAHVIFILATTEVHKLPATILSRCQRFDFRRIGAEDIAARLEFIAQEENASIDHNAALLIARIADGGMRDAVSLLDQCLSRSKSVGEDVVRDAAGLTGNDHLFSLSDAILKKDAAALLGIVDELHCASKDMIRLCEELIAHYRSLMIIATVKNPDGLIVTTGEELARLRQDAQQYSLAQILNILDTLQNALGRMSGGAHRRTELELALLRLCKVQETSSTEALEKRIASLEKAVRQGIPAAPAAMQVSAEKSPKPAYSEINKLSDSAVPFDGWDEILSRLSVDSAALSSMLAGSRAYTSGSYMLVETSDMGADMLRTPNARETLRRLLAEQTGQNWKLGPFKPTEKRSANAVASPLAALEERAKSLGIAVESDSDQ
ncbi:MAG: DNA polymerase III subunit gamma/tau [Ruminococcaceae bacterium]|nr:DNA polymerase III subunit gamma/tau [Oscillospiraceae bacterium]